MGARRAAPLAFIALVALAPLAVGSFWTFVLTLGVVYALLALSLVVLAGWSGQLNLHVAALGLGWGAYAAFALVAYDVPPVWALLAAGLVTVPFAAAVAAVAVRFRGLELAVATLALGLIFERLFFRNVAKALARAAEGVTTPFESSFVPMPRPTIGPLETRGDLAFFYFCLVVAAALFVVVLNLSRASTGRILRAIREREIMAETLGIPVIRYRIGAFVFSILLAATAGGLFASFKQGIAPDSFNLDLSFQVLAATVIGGIRSPAGAVIGGALTALLPEVVRFGPLRVFGGERLFLLFGIGMILVLWRMPTGLAGLGGARGRPADDGEDAPPVPSARGAAGDGEIPAGRPVPSPLMRHARPSILRVQDVRVRFGGVVALDGVSLFVPQGEICALIGPNGAGKSTLFNCVSGLITPDEGQIYFAGGDVTELPPHRRAALGIGRTFQTVEVFRELTVRENVLVACHLVRRAGSVQEAFALPATRRSERILHDRAREILGLLGLERLADRRPADLPLGVLRELEVGMALAARPRLLLLDEPSAGLAESETEALARAVARVRATQDVAVLLVEHDMALVASLADHAYALDFGAVVAEGSVDEVRRDPVVLATYLGEDAVVPAGGGRRARR